MAIKAEPEKVHLWCYFKKIVGVYSIKGSIIAEYLAYRVVEDDQPMEFDFLDKDIDSISQEEKDYKGWMMLFNGVVNVWGHGIGTILISLETRLYPVVAKLTFPCTNNMAEYEACIFGLQVAMDQDIKELVLKGDSTLVIHQVTGEWENRDSKLVPYQGYIQEIIKGIDSISFSHLPRENNLIPDALETLVALIKVELGVEIDPIQIRIQLELAHCAVVEEANEKS
ncbi:uncharacterized protein LOC131162705 [Malania oleifera]|uniref:uncharacterized protein LOC131162705 n=1 Tax=Malania oleifera TaxID=397392 RepID=UPI0025AE3546|nr:uncharacterized protein LOC131162705 [Malania oleifera]